MSEPTSHPPRRRLNRLALFAIAMAVLALAVVVAANLLFDRFAMRPLKRADQSAAAPAAHTAAPKPAPGAAAPKSTSPAG